MKAQVQSMLDRVVGPGNSTVAGHRRPRLRQGRLRHHALQHASPSAVPLSAATSTEKYAGPGAAPASAAWSVPTAQIDVRTTTTGRRRVEVRQEGRRPRDNARRQDRRAPRGRARATCRACTSGSCWTPGRSGRSPPRSCRTWSPAPWASTPSAGTPSRSPRCRSTAPPKGRRRPSSPQAAAAATRRDRSRCARRRHRAGDRRDPAARLAPRRARPKARDRGHDVRRRAAAPRVDRADRRAAAEPAGRRAAPAPDPSELRRRARDEIAAMVERQPEEVAAAAARLAGRGGASEMTLAPQRRPASARPPSCWSSSARSGPPRCSRTCREREVEAISAEIARAGVRSTAAETESVLAEFRDLATARANVLRGGAQFARALLRGVARPRARRVDHEPAGGLGDAAAVPVPAPGRPAPAAAPSSPASTRR